MSGVYEKTLKKLNLYRKNAIFEEQIEKESLNLIQIDKF